MPVDLNLRALDAFRVKRLHGVRGAGDERPRVLMEFEVGEHPVGERPRVAALGPPDADPEPQELLRLQVLRNRPQAVVTRKAAPQPELKPPELEVTLVVHDEDGVGTDLEEGRSRTDRATRLFMYVSGFRSASLWPSSLISAIRPENFERHEPPCRRASSSTTIAPTLWRLRSYSRPGLPSPTTSRSSDEPERRGQRRTGGT